MKKIATFVLAAVMVVGLVGCSGGVSQEEYDKVVKENSELSTRNEELSRSLDEALKIAKKYLNQASDAIETRDIIISATAKLMEENSDCTIINDNLIQITIQKGNESTEAIKEKIQSYAAAIPTALKNSEFQSCIIMVVDEDGICNFGYTIKDDESVSTFISDKFE